MTDDETKRFDQLLGRNLDRDGTIVPTDEALEHVAREYSDRPDAEKYRLAQAQTLIEIFEAATRRDGDRP